MAARPPVRETSSSASRADRCPPLSRSPVQSVVLQLHLEGATIDFSHHATTPSESHPAAADTNR